MKQVHVVVLMVLTSLLLAVPGVLSAAGPDLIVFDGKVVAVDAGFSVHQAMAVESNRIVAVGRNEEIVKLKTDQTEMLDLNGKMVLPGLFDSHTHPVGAALIEFDHPIPDMETIQDVLNYFKSRAAVVKEGEWIVLQQVFITRLHEQRYPTRAELDQVAPQNPVVFRTGPDASVNTLALKLSGIDKDFRVTDGGTGYAEKDPKTGEPTGILRNLSRYLKIRDSGRQPTARERYERVLSLFQDYSSVGITGICDGDVEQEELDLYEQMLGKGELPVRISAQYHVDNIGPIEQIQENIRKVAKNPLRQGGPMLRVIGVKAYLDGGMLTGSAYMSKPWGISKTYAIDDPKYQGVLFIPKERLIPMARTATECGLQFTAHTVGDGAVATLLDAYEEVNKTTPIREVRHCITHSNFMNQESVEKMARLHVFPLIQPAWLYLDTRTLVGHFGYDRLRYFQPLKSLFEAGAVPAGGSDHMQKIGSLRSNNFYDPFLAMWTAVTRQARWYEGKLHPEEALNREQVIRFYTINCARALFQDRYVGSLERGKLADFIVLDTDLLTCPADGIRDAKVLRTYMDGRLVFQR
jgi:predicted amidohydrolase YtcJ